MDFTSIDIEEFASISKYQSKWGKKKIIAILTEFRKHLENKKARERLIINISPTEKPSKEEQKEGRVTKFENKINELKQK